MTRFVLHLPAYQLPGVRNGPAEFYRILEAALTKAGGEVELRERMYLRAHAGFEPEAFHFVHQGLVEMPNVLNTGPSYLQDFWYADPKGVFGLSSIYDLKFDPETVRPERAAKFNGWLRERLLETRLSKHGQPAEATKHPANAIAVFLQGESLPVKRAAYTDEVSMVAALIAARGGRDVLIKRHPRNKAEESWLQIEALVAQSDGAHIVDGNLNDILGGAALCASISSSVAVEAMLHKVPSLTFGRVDFHHCTQTVQNLTDVPAALDAALDTDWPFEPYLFWFFRHHCLDMKAKTWLDKLNKRMGAFSLKELR